MREKQQQIDCNKIGDVCKTISRTLAVGNNSDKFVTLLFESEMSSHSFLFVSNKNKVLLSDQWASVVYYSKTIVERLSFIHTGKYKY